MAVSQNGWPVSPARSARLVPGTGVRLTVADGPAGDVLIWVADQFSRRVESLDLKSSRGEFDDWGYANRPIRGSTVTSNHASATAVDFNATRHPLGVTNTFTPEQVKTIRSILAEVDYVVRWGGNYSGRVDEMHFELDAPESKVARVAERLRRGGGMVADFDTVRRNNWDSDDTYGNALDWTEWRVAQMAGTDPKPVAHRVDVGYARDQIRQDIAAMQDALITTLATIATDVQIIKAKLEATE